MLLKIDLGEGHKVIHVEDRRIILYVPSGSLHLCTVRGRTLTDFEANPVERSKHLSIGSRGGIDTMLDGIWHGDVSKDYRLPTAYRWGHRHGIS